MKWRDILGVNARNRNLIMVCNRRRDFWVADSKTACKRWLAEQGLPTPPLIDLIESSKRVRPFLNEVARPDGFVVKPDGGRRGQGVKVVHVPFGPREPVAALRTELWWLMRRILAGEFRYEHGKDLVLVEERVVGNGFAERVAGYPGADIRIICHGDKVIMGMLRLPTAKSGGRANLHQGGLGVGIDMDAGCTSHHAVLEEKFVTRHPDTGCELGGLPIPEWKTAIMPAARAVAAKCPLRYCGIDIMMDARRGPQIIEINARPGLAIQLANGSSLRERVLRTVSVGVLLFLLAAGSPVYAQAPTPGAKNPGIPVGTAQSQDLVEDAAVEKERTVAEGLLALQRSPQDPAAYNDLAVALWKSGQRKEATNRLRQAIKLDPKYHRAYYNLGTFYLLEEQWAKAEQVLKKAIELRPYYTEARYNYGLALKRRGRLGEAAEQFRSIGDISKSARHYKAYYNLGLCNTALGNDRDAVRAYRRALELNVGHAPSHMNLGIALSRLGFTKEAHKSYRDALALDPDNWLPYFNLAIALERIGTPKDGLEVLASMPATGRARPEVLNLLGNLFMGIGEHEKGASSYEQAYRRSSSPEHLYNLARAQSALGLVEKAMVTYEDVLRDQPDYDEAAFNLALLARRNQDFEKATRTLRGLIERSPDHAPGLYTLGTIYKDLDQTSKGVPLLRRAVELEPEKAEYRFALGLAFQRSNDPDAALGHYGEAQRLDPNERRYPYNAGLIHLRAERYEEAIGTFRRAVAADPDYYEALYNLGLALLRAGKPRQAIQELEQARDVKPDNPQAWNNLGLAYADARDLPGAAKAYSRAIELDPADATAYFNLALLYRRSGRRKEAARLYRRALQAGATSPTLLNNLALMEAKAGYPSSAERIYRLALELDPGYKTAALNLSALLSRQKEPDRALAVLRPFFEDGSATPEMYYNDGLAKMRAGRHQDAVERFRQALLQRPNYVEARHNLGLLYLRKGEPERAQEVLATVAETGVSAPRTLFNLALAQLRAEDHEDAETTLDSIVEAEPDYEEAHYNLGLVCMKQRKYDKARQNLQRATEIRPGYSEAWYNLGLVCLRTKDQEAALAAFRSAVEHKEDYPEAWYNIGVAHQRTRDPDMVEAFRKATELAPGNGKYFASLGRSLQSQRAYSDAADVFGKAIDLIDDPDEKLLSRHAFCLSRAGRHDEADAAYGKLILRHPENMTHAFNHAVLKTRLGEDEAAGQIYGTILEQNPGYYKAWNNLAYVHMRGARFDEARDCLEKIKTIEPSYPGLSTSYADLENMVAGGTAEGSIHARAAHQAQP